MFDKGRVSELDSDLAELLRANWRPLSSSALKREVIAVDGSRALRRSASGAYWYVVRSLALLRKERFRELEIDAFLSRTTSADVDQFISVKTEHQEFEVARKAIVEANMSNVALLIDGSLYGRMTHLPRDVPPEGAKDFMLTYFRTYYELLELCRARKILIIGVSKDSMSSFLRNYFLSLLFSIEINSLADIDREDKERLTSIFDQIFIRPSFAMAPFRELRRKYGSRLDRIQSILSEAFSARPDHQLIRNHVHQAGYSSPIELTVSGRNVDLIKRIQTNPEAFIKQYFKGALLEHNNEKEFINNATKSLNLLSSFPTIVSFHVLLDPRDTPIRVDTPSWTFGRDQRVGDLEHAVPAKDDLTEIIGLLVAGYGGLRNYNIWLKRVDQEVKLTRKTLDDLYGPILEKALGLQIVHTRGYRRVKYP
jgi:hypothetical protein